jgi:hypothetical protein
MRIPKFRYLILAVSVVCASASKNISDIFAEECDVTAKLNETMRRPPLFALISLLVQVRRSAATFALDTCVRR